MDPVVFTQAARTELIEAQDWYEKEAPGLGMRFHQAVDAIIGRINDNPRIFPVIYRSIRRALLRRFPYSLLFIIGPDESLRL